MEKFAKMEINKLLKEYTKTKDHLVLEELKQFIDHLPKLIR